MKELPSPDSVAKLASSRLATATVARVDDDGAVFIRFDEGPGQRARIAAPVPNLDVGAAVVVLLEPDRDGDPVIVSSILDRVPDRVTLQCGEASIELHADGRIEIRGTHIDSESEGIQRIKGAQVRIN